MSYLPQFICGTFKTRAGWISFMESSLKISFPREVLCNRMQMRWLRLPSKFRLSRFERRNIEGDQWNVGHLLNGYLLSHCSRKSASSRRLEQAGQKSPRIPPTTSTLGWV